MDKKVIWEAVKEPLRLLVLAIIPILLTYFAGLSYEWAGVLVVLLRFVDKLLHEIGSAKEAEGTKKAPIVSSLTGGLTRF